jgi:hypothetical protein
MFCHFHLCKSPKQTRGLQTGPPASRTADGTFTLALLALLVTVQAASAASTIDGCIAYNGVPLARINVRMRNANGVLIGETNTDNNGCYAVQTESSPDRYRLIFRAENAAALVHQTGPHTPRRFETELFDFTGSELRTEVELSDFDADVNPRVGESLWLAGEVYRIRSWFSDETGLVPAQVPIEFPAGLGPHKAYYWGPGGGIHIGRDELMSLYHEYGHFLMDEYASWIDIPYYGDDACAVGHWVCIAQAYEVWPYFEAFAHLVAALSYESSYLYGSLSGINPMTGQGSSQLWIGVPTSLIGGSGTCSNGDIVVCGTDIINDPLLTEGAIAGALFDLAYTDPEGFAAIWEVVTHIGDELYENPAHAGGKPNPLTAVQFFETYQELHSNPGPVPYAWFAFDQNFMNFDDEVPAPPELVSASHEEGIWFNDSHIEITCDQYDDVSGVWEYRVVFDQDATTTLAFTAGDWQASGLQEYGDTTETTFTTTVYSSGVYYLHFRGRDFYGLVHPGNGRTYPDTTTYGPILVDLEPPLVTTYQPQNTETFLVSSEIEIEWQVEDQPQLSGIARVEVRYSDPANSILGLPIETFSYPQAPALVRELHTWQIPSSVRPTDSGQIVVEAWDVAGNGYRAELIEEISIRELFDPEAQFIVAVTDGDVSAADFDEDGYDDLACAGTGNSGPKAAIYRSSSGSMLLHQSLTGLEDGAVEWGDFNRDGALDLVISGADAGGNVETIFYFQDPVMHTFSNQGDLGAPGVRSGDIAAGDLDLDGDLDLVIVGEGGSGLIGDMYLVELGSFVLRPLGAKVATGGGDVELIDIDSDGDLDISIAGFSREIQVLENDLDTDTFTPITVSEPIPYGFDGQIDWGDPSGTGSPAMALMLTTLLGGSTGVWNNTDHSGLIENTYWTAALGGGDLIWGDVDNDGDADLMTMGSDTSGSSTSLFITYSEGVTMLEITEVLAVSDAALAWCDADGDSDLDLLVMGDNGLNLYTNLAASYFANLAPDAPSGVAVMNCGSGDHVISWNPPPGGDDHTPLASLTYDLLVTESGGDIIFSGTMPVKNGNVFWRTTFELLDTGYFGNIYAYVRAVDGSFRRSPWSP